MYHSQPSSRRPDPGAQRGYSQHGLLVCVRGYGTTLLCTLTFKGLILYPEYENYTPKLSLIRYLLWEQKFYGEMDGQRYGRTEVRMEGYLSFSLSSVNSNSCWAQSLINSSRASSIAERSESSACSFFCWGAAPKLFRSDPLQGGTDMLSAAARRGARLSVEGELVSASAFPLTPSMWLCPSALFSRDSLYVCHLGWPRAQQAT